MANQKTTSKQILQNRVNGVVKSYENFKTSLKNNRNGIKEDEFEAMLVYLEKTSVKQVADLRKIYSEKEDKFVF